MKQLSLDNLRAFVAVVDLGGYAKAGDYLGRSQPAISLQIKRLEEQLGKKLFNKAGQRQLVNADGLALYQHAVQILSLNDDIFRQFEQTPLSGQLRLGLPSEFATRLLPSIIGDFNKAYPDVTLEVTCELSKHLLQAERRKQFDLILALSDEPRQDQPEMLLSDELVWVANPNYRPEEDKLALVVAPTGCIYRKRALERLQSAGRSWRISYTNADIGGITAALKEGLGVTVLARSTLPAELAVLKHKSLPTLGQVGINLYIQPGKHRQASGKLAEFIRSRLGYLIA
ncbi:LysR family transcriptional regulator [Aliiglaciecola sp. CAU 1673]|uniref:LysR family transcriptional regulator n=1 Tax=Aliiglaciecola sp. CAU 1673 TaxID=3032595 RepID=UPI0023DBB292|nr:LysR family transcriptional regulator [Aliiglaciecola sp. CAU 1673]MDF2176864.1 LysR family transcriptional regulator [Aliiglaciecola sp. CAU 1673]